MATNPAIIYVLPIILLLWLAWWPMRNTVGLVLQSLALLSLILAIAMARAWVPIPIFWVAALIVLAVVVAIRARWDWPDNKIPQTPYGWLGVVTLLLVTGFSLWIATIAFITGYWHQGVDIGVF